MSRTITALFDQRSDADAAKNRLEQSNVHASHVSIHDKTSSGYNEQGYSTGKEPGFWGSVKHAFLPEEDRHTYEEGVRRGGFLLTADVNEDQIDDAVRVLEESNSIDVDDRSKQWREQGWAYGAAGAGTAGMGAADYDRTGRATDGLVGSGASEGEQVIPVVEEELIVGKREVDRGGARVRSYVTEMPVHEQMRLREERINVERRPVDRPVSDADDAFRERTIDVTATGEEAVVRKDARVVEEVVVSKSADTRVEDIDDTVRRTEVEIDDDTRAGGTGYRDDRR